MKLFDYFAKIAGRWQIIAVNITEVDCDKIRRIVGDDASEGRHFKFVGSN